MRASNDPLARSLPLVQCGGTHLVRLQPSQKSGRASAPARVQAILVRQACRPRSSANQRPTTQVKERKGTAKTLGPGQREHPAARRKPPKRQRPSASQARTASGPASYERKVGSGTLLGSAVPLFAPTTFLAAVGGLVPPARLVLPLRGAVRPGW